MKSKPVRFGRAIVLSILFFVTIFSLFGGRDGSDASTRNMVHIWAGSLMLIGSAVHLATNLDWVRAGFSRPMNSLKKRVRQNRRTDLCLFISGLICAIAGMLWLLLSQATPNLLERSAHHQRRLYDRADGHPSVAAPELDERHSAAVAKSAGCGV